jgi:putative lipoprotein
VSRAAAVATFACLGLLLHSSPASADADPWFARDKALHFAGSTFIAGGAYASAAALDVPDDGRLWVGGLTALGAGAGKELWDLAGHGDPSWRDLAWDGLGTATGLVTAWWVDRWWRRHHARSSRAQGVPASFAR